MLSPAAPLSHSRPRSRRKASAPSSPWHGEQERREQGSREGWEKLEPPKAAASSAETKQLVEEVPVCLLSGMTPASSQAPKDKGRDSCTHKSKANTPISAFNSPINSQKRSRQGTYSIFAPCVPSNGSCIMFHAEGNYLLKFVCTGGANALIFCRCLSWTHSLQMLWPTMRCAFLF